MDRRTLLASSGVALAAALAGCSSSDTDDPLDDESEDADGTDSDADGDASAQDGDGSDGNGTDRNGDTEDGDGSAQEGETESEEADDTGNSDSGGDDADALDRNGIPGFDADAFTIGSDRVTVDRVERDGSTVRVDATTTTTDRVELYDELGSLGSDLEAAVTDPERFEGAIDRVEFTLVDGDGDRVGSFHARSRWIVGYVTGRLTEDEFYDRVVGTAG
ncbi:hypothetical protein [Halosolutus gelatinilyticus]|uniref:hypothetical protein n=1 Tax=Halosolutus gelatinilyticus TaxID=2931975 RepID=UPI001FF3665A|nr:hypothetical protein [Halosolutus gelatinilyticus]